MAIEAKVSFLNQLEKLLSEEIPAGISSRVLSLASDALESFSMQEETKGNDEQNDLLECYLSALKVESKSPETLRLYSYVLRRVLSDANVPVRKVTVYHLRTFLAKEQDRGIADKTIRNYRSILCSFFNWLQREGLIERNPTTNLGVVKCAEKTKTTYTSVDKTSLADNCTKELFRFDVRNRAIVEFLASSGCRISEMLNLNRDAVNLSSLECVVHGKGAKDRKIYLDPVCGVKLKEYLETRTDDNEALFVNRNNQRIKPGGVRTMLNKLAKEANVEHVHPHKFRRTLATDLTRRGMPVQEVARILGHSKLDTTMQYVVMNDEEIKSAYRKYY